MTTIGFIGSGNIGGTVARLAAAQGYDVVISNSRGPQTLAGLAGEIGERARAATRDEAARAGELVVLSVPLQAYDDLPADALAGKVVLTTDNYYPQRDGQIPALDGGATSAGWLQERFPDSKVVKVFNHITAADLASRSTPAGTENRRALAVFGDDEGARALVADLVDQLGFDAVDGGPLAESWRIQPGTPGYGPDLDRAGLTEALAKA
jgi:predicted dinucleotide-binding enzyme